LRDIEVVAPNLSRRFSGVTATVVALVPLQAHAVGIAAIGPGLPAHVPRVGWGELLRHGWRPPPGRTARVWHARRNVEMVAGIILAKLLRQPWKLVFTSAAQRHHKPLTRWLIRRMDAVIATSGQSASFLTVPSTVIMHGVDTVRFRPAADRTAEWVATGPGGQFGIGVFGRVRHQKGTDLFVEAMCRLLPTRPDWTAVIVGLAKPEDRDLFGGSKTRSRGAIWKGGLCFLASGRSQNCRRGCGGSRSLFRRPAGRASAWCRWRRWPAGRRSSPPGPEPPPISSSTGVTGRLVPADDADALASAAAWLMDLDPPERARLELSARRHAERNHSINGEVRAIQSVYQALLEA
jgi:mannosyltransferase